MNFRDLLNKLDEAEQAAAAPVWTPSPEQKAWIGGANQQDPYILSRMPGQKPPINWFTDPADQELARRMGFPETAKPAPEVVAAAQASADTQGSEVAREKLKQLMTLLTKMKGAPAAVKESIEADIAKQLIESFGYTQEQLDELSMQDVGDFGRGAWNGATLGTGSNIAAGAKSLFKGTKYKDELSKELAADKEAQSRSPYAYGAGNIGGAIGSSFVVPGAGVGNLAARGAAKLGAGVAGQALAKGATMVGTNLALQKGIDTAVDAHNKDVLGQPAGAKSGTTDPRLAKLQKVIGANPDGVMGPETKQKLTAWQQSQGIKADGMPGPETYGKAGIKESASEQYARLRDMLEAMESEEKTDEGVVSSLASLGKNFAGGMKGWNVVGQQAAKGAVDAAGKKIGGQALKATGAERLANKAGSALAGASTKAGTAIKGAAGKAGGAIARNPGKTALGVAGAAYGLSQLGGGSEQPAGAATGSTKPSAGNKPTGDAAANTQMSQEEMMAQVDALMSELSQYDIPEIQQGLVQARQMLSQIKGDANIGSLDKPAAPAPAPNSGTDINTLKVYGKDAADTAAKTAAAKAAAGAPSTAPK